MTAHSAMLAAPLPELLAQATEAGTGFRLQGRAVRVTGASRMPQDLSSILKARCGELWDHLGGTALDQPSLELLKTLDISLVIPKTVAAAETALAEIANDSALHTPAELHDRPKLVGFDVETGARPGIEQRPVIKLKNNGYPIKKQPALKKNSDAGLDPSRSYVRLAQCYAGGSHCCVLDTNLVPLDLLKPFLQRHTAIIHNASFELGHLAAAGIEIPYYEDTMQAVGLLRGTRHRRLEHAAAAYLDIAVSKGLQRSDWSAPYLSAGQYAYAALDAIIAFGVWLKLRLELIEKHRGGAYLLQRDVARPVARMTARGILIDRAAHAPRVESWKAAHQEAETAFITKTGEAPPTTPRLTRTYLQKVLPQTVLDSWPRTQKTHELTIAAAQLRRVAYLPDIKFLLAVTAARKLISSFGATLIDKISPTTGRLHPSYNIAAAKTGRFSASEPNVQQFPNKDRAPDFRCCVVAKAGWVLVAGDFNMMELRAAAWVSNDPIMTDDFRRGVDIHKRTAAGMLKIAIEEVDDVARKRAKPVNFSIIFGAGAAGIVATAWVNYGIDMPLEEAQEARQAFLGRYAAYARWKESAQPLARERDYIVIGRLGRVIEGDWEVSATGKQATDDEAETDTCYADDDLENDESEINAHDERLKYTLCINAPIQGSCADASMLALLKVDNALREAGIAGGPILFVHDEIVLEVPEKDAEEARRILTECMVSSFAEIFPGAPLNDVVSTGIGPNWKDAKP
jgi:DNA polymerase I-like protein with 3'-5' exonuclease and polymerase domains